jgi:hypothetical protein
MTRTRIPPFAFLLLVFASMTGEVFAQAQESAVGYWSGNVNLAAGPLAIRVWINRNPEGVWGGTLDIPAQNTTDLHLVVTAEGRSINFRFPGGEGAQSFRGTLSEDGSKISGSFRHLGESFPFELTREKGPPERKLTAAQEIALANARRILELLRQQKFAEVVKEFDAQMAVALPLEKVDQEWAAVRAQAGDFKSELSQNVSQAGPATIVTLGCQFERAALSAVFVFDWTEKLSSLQFLPRAPN